MGTAALQREEFVTTITTPMEPVLVPKPAKNDEHLQVEPCPVCEGWGYADMEQSCNWCTNGLIDSRYLPWILLAAEMQGDLDDDMVDLCAEIRQTE